MKVSIITIAYNDLEGLRVTHESIRRQTFRDFEWLVVDGGSADGTRQFLEEHDEELAWWCSERDEGVYNAQNKGTQHARGEYCIYMNSADSFYSADVLERIFSQDITADVIYGDWMLVFENGERRLGPAPDSPDMAYFFNQNICHQAMLVKRELVLKRPYDESFGIYGDWDEWLALYTQGCSFAKVDLTVCTFMLGGLSSGGTPEREDKRRKEMERIKQMYYPEPWRETMERVVPMVNDYEALRKWAGKGKDESFGAAFGEREYLIRKRRQHNRTIRLLIYLCCLLLLAVVMLAWRLTDR